MVWWRKRNKKLTLARGATLLEDLIECCDGKFNPIKFFSADEIIKATNDFNEESNGISELDEYYSEWYSGKTKNHEMMILIKKHANEEETFCRDTAVSSMVSGHKNFMKLVGCCVELKDPFLVYDGVKKHSKFKISEQPWKRRMKIAEDIATALAYLHTAFPRPFVYRFLCPWKILLDEDGVAKLNDFSLCVSIPQGETFVNVEGMPIFGSMESEYLKTNVVSEKTDVFAFGMLMQHLLVGEDRFWKIWVREEGNSEVYEDDDDSFQVRLFKFMEKRGIKEIADPKMLEEMCCDSSELELCQMNAFLMLSHRSIGFKGEVPTAVEVAKELKKIQIMTLSTVVGS
ncbi:hypothetical protein CARUB_v10020591mg [Capsella rubella]|uniref:Protein kinase domain-containing protein n=1 Tax=Capsella rubella TaxID=81985 RepID=R0GI14_9BRAS|nr:probable inactive receptor-like protein kinase At1g65250 [Capsella rubella]EOA35396.1 hypothetical protein CARUB_v10020591mg [Capsella rubella]